MSLINEKGSTWTKTGIKFPDENQVDFSRGGHPAVILLDAADSDDHIYSLVASSKVEKYVRNPAQYLIIKNDSHNGLKQPSIFNLENIFKDENRIKNIKGNLKPNDYSDLITKFKTYQVTRKDSLFEEIKDKL